MFFIMLFLKFCVIFFDLLNDLNVLILVVVDEYFIDCCFVLGMFWFGWWNEISFFFKILFEFYVLFSVLYVLGVVVIDFLKYCVVILVDCLYFDCVFL